MWPSIVRTETVSRLAMPNNSRNALSRFELFGGDECAEAAPYFDYAGVDSATWFVCLIDRSEPGKKS